MKIILNADDFGRNNKANINIAKCFEEGLINSTTIMMNMPSAADAIEIAKKQGFQDKIGVHIVLDEGVPLTDDIKKVKKFCDELGRFKEYIPRHQLLNREEKQAIYHECMAQISAARNMGIIPTHMDSHRHRHQDIIIASIVKKVAFDSNIKYIRKYKSKGSFLHKIYGMLIDTYYKVFSEICSSDYFYGIFDYDCKFIFRNKCCVEIMCHPEHAEDMEQLKILKKQLKINNDWREK